MGRLQIDACSRGLAWLGACTLPRLPERACVAAASLLVRHAPGRRVLTCRGSQGAFGQVWRVRKRASNEEFALKVMESDSPDIMTPDVVAECARSSRRLAWLG